MLQVLISVGAALLVFVLYMVMLNSLQRESMSKRIKRLAPSREEAEDIVGRHRDTKTSGLAGTLEPMLRAMGMRPQEFRRTNFYKFYRAGIDPVDGPIYYRAWQVFMTPILALIAFHLASQPAAAGIKIALALVACILILLGILGPSIMVTNSRQKREKKLVRAFPDSLDLLLVCTESGLALDGALARVCKELGSAYPEVTDELNKTRLELTMLNDRERALQNLAERTDLVPFRSLVAALLQTERFGTSLADTLRVLADEYRNTRLMLAEQKAGRLPVLMTLPLVLLMLPAFFLIIMGPAVVSVFEVTG